MTLSVYEPFIEQFKKKLIQDHRFTGLLAGGSMLTGMMDEYSDLDLIAVYQPGYREEIMNQRLSIAEEPGNLLAAFTGEHVGEPRLIICLYGPPPLHVDIKFITPNELEERMEDPLILWERGEEISKLLKGSSVCPPRLDPQWIEDRFWIWVHYGATKLGRGELFELMDLISFMRSSVLGPMILVRNGQLPRGVRKLEQLAPGAIEELEETVPVHNPESCYNALQATIRLYRRLRQQTSGQVRREEAERVSVVYLEMVFASLSNG